MPDDDDKTLGEKIDALVGKASSTTEDIRRAIKDVKVTYERVKARRAERKAAREAGGDSPGSDSDAD